MTKFKNDPLGDVTLWWLSENDYKRCNCPAQEDHSMMHSDLCSVSPTFAAMVSQYGNPRFIMPIAFIPNKPPSMKTNFLRPISPILPFDRECSCAATEISQQNCPAHGENAPEY